jgi:multisubunit Na+/H+ antiporter MnhF subunit
MEGRRRAVGRRITSGVAGARGVALKEHWRVALHEIVFYVAAVWMTALLAVCAASVALLRSTASRILALDTLTLVLVALLVLYADSQRSAFYLDAALVLALLSFIGTLAASRYYGERKGF